jgi:REP element-mobilizing transposase RayT
MPRRKRGWIDGACYHITHRCHNREFLFHYKKYRQFYQRQLFDTRLEELKLMFDDLDTACFF